MTSCGRGRDSATRECFGRGSQRGRFSFEARKYLFSFQSYDRFEEFFFVSRAFENLAPNFQALRLLVSTMSWRFFLKTPLRHRAFFCQLRRHGLRPQVFFLKISFLFSKTEPVVLALPIWRSPSWAKHFGDGTSKTRMKTWLLCVGEIERREGPWIVVAIGTSRVQQSMVQKKKKTQGSQRVIVRRLNPSSSTNQLVFEEPVSETRCRYRFALRCFRRTWVVQLQDSQAAARGKRRKAVIRDISGIGHWGVTNLSAPISFAVQGHCNVFRHVMQLSLLVLYVGKALSRKRDHFQTLATGVPKLKTWLGTQRVKRKKNWEALNKAISSSPLRQNSFRVFPRTGRSRGNVLLCLYVTIVTTPHPSS